MDKRLNKLALGTVQFGLDYGITNTNGKVQLQEVRKVLKTCRQNHISILDTARLYGDSEEVLGNSLQAFQNDFRIVSKLPPCVASEVQNLFKQSITNLGVKHLYGYIIHNYETFQKDKQVYNELKKIKEEGLVQKIGFSLYHPMQLEEILAQGITPDLIQIPYSVLDQRFNNVLTELKSRNVEVHVRSVFLQGLLLKSLEELPMYFASLKPKLVKINEISFRCNVKLSHLLLAFVHLNENISSLVIGVTSDEELLENLQYVNTLHKVENVLPELKALAEEDEHLILPTNWK